MDDQESLRLMHACLDGEASADERAMLERLLEKDPWARAEYDRLRSFFEAIGQVQAVEPPADLAEHVTGMLRRTSQARTQADQLPVESRVIGPFGSDVDSGTRSARIIHIARTRSETTRGSRDMSKSRRGLWIVGGVAAAVAALLVSNAVEFPSRGDPASGTIAPAERYRAPQPGEVKLNDAGPGSRAPATAATVPPGNEARLQAGNEARLEAGNEARTKAGNEARTPFAGNEARTVQAGNEAARLQAGNEAVKLQAGNEAVKLQAGNEAKLQAGNEAKLKAGNEAKLQAGNEAARLQAGNEAVKLQAGNQAVPK